MIRTRNVPPETASPESEARLRRWQRVTLAVLVVGYAGYYLCRSDLSIATPLLLREYGPRGLDKEVLGRVVSLGVLVYACGKFLNGSLADLLGGKRLFLTGMVGAVVCTALIGAGGLPLFTLAWAVNRLVQSGGWVGMVRVASRWFSHSEYGFAMGVASLSFLFGDFASRLFLGQLVSSGAGWRGVFLVSAGVLGVIFLASALLLRETPRQVGLPEPEANPENLYGEAGRHAEHVAPRDLLGPLLKSRLFWWVCALSFGFTLMRETFNTWIPQYLTEVHHMDPGAAGKASSLFPLFGGISVLLAGYLSDRIQHTGRAILLLASLVVALPGLVVLSRLGPGSSNAGVVLLLGALAFVLIGPYSLLAGAISLDFGGKRGSATACGWIDGVGYLGGIVAGQGIGAMAEGRGWGTAYMFLAAVTALSAMAALFYWREIASQAARRMDPVLSAADGEQPEEP